MPEPESDHITQTHSDAASRIVLYDGVCNLCNASVRFIIKRDSRGLYRFASLQSETGRALAMRHGIDPDAMESFVLIDEAGASTKSDAWLSILVTLGSIWRLMGLLRWVPRPLRDAVYDLVGRWRYRLWGRTTHCQMPAPGDRERFLDTDMSTQGRDHGE